MKSSRATRQGSRSGGYSYPSPDGPCRLELHATDLDENAARQIEQIIHHPAIAGTVAIMPDAHAGMGCVIGFTGRFRDAVIPNIVGVDIGCGVAVHPLKGITTIDYPRLDRFVRQHVPLGMHSRKSPTELEKLAPDASLRGQALDLCRNVEKAFFEKEKIGKHINPALQLGTLGGGNHFIEIDRSDRGELFLLVHSGSRNFGKRVAEHFQDCAREATRTLRVQVPPGLEFLPMADGGDDYLHWAKIAQTFAAMNRQIMLTIALSYFDLPFERTTVIESVHNYISPGDGLVRKGAISAHQGERVVVPLNMADGTIIGIGRSNPSFNHSAPHGAGRLHGRKEMIRRLDGGEFSLKQYRESMQGIFTTSLSRETFDESKFAYKPLEMIRPHLEATVEITDHLHPVYNLKAADD